ncbi:GYDIA family GHMP kinase [Pontimicrobium aquaticum]|uniref:GHMP kinase n=1 Tax=Pontimicrobium aquaticum TaxID=2565367 RepID=A0A4U0F1P0_9FLAO|nr:GYDIA family GHMP kinase [Pontimicrobium aquaticum]TJY37684.1 GHMP kinase [Pontimicrobium aquaticum]
MPKGFVYILECSDGSYYTGSTIDIEKRLMEHKNGKGANHTKKRLPVQLVYLEEFQRIDDAFYREKQIQGWNRQKKDALIKNKQHLLPEIAMAYRDKEASRTSASKTKNKMVPKKHENTNKMYSFYSNGKLLITGEYTVLDGALALAIPTKYGQSLTVENINENKIVWTSLDYEGNKWFEVSFKFEQVVFPFLFEYSQETLLDNDISKTVLNILNTIHKENKTIFSNFIESGKGLKFITKLDFPRNWGLGSSSTLINNIANWAKVDAFKLLELTFGGSGYDIACAEHNFPITYQLENSYPNVKEVHFNPSFKNLLYFVHLNKKKNSREGIMEYNKNKKAISDKIKEINSITKNIISCTAIEEFNLLIEAHETIISSIIKQPTIKDLLFKDFNGFIKSLGAWGGDFILVSSTNNPSNYFKDKGYNTVIPYSKMVLN